MLYLDLDGVFLNFDGHKDTFLSEWTGRSYHHLSKEDWTLEEHARNSEVETCMGTEGFWKPIPLFPDAYILWDFCSFYNPVILTAVPNMPKWKEQITYEKNKSIDHYFGFKTQRIICLRSEKQLYAHDISDILVDDTIQNI